jgi:hypothetical protein
MAYNPNFPLLSFIHQLYSDNAFQAAFKADPEKCMDEYKLTWEQKVAIYHSGANPMFLTDQAVPGYPRLLDASKFPPNPVSADWWAAYARFKADVEAGKNPAPIPNPLVNDRREGDRVSLAGVMLLLGEELAKQPGWDGPW